AAQINPSALSVAEDIRWSRSEGAGVGYPTGRGLLARTSSHSGLRRFFMVWNPLPFEREQLCDITLWDWPGDSSRIRVQDGYGQHLPHQLLTTGKDQYWGHQYQNVSVFLRVPAAGYRTIMIDEWPSRSIPVSSFDLRTLKPDRHVLENDYLRVELSPLNATIVSFIDKETGLDLVGEQQATGMFRLIREDASRGMTAWVVGAYQQISSLHGTVRFTERSFGPLCQKISWTTTFGHGSSLSVTLALHHQERLLRLQVQVTWQEIGSLADGLPQLNFHLPLKKGEKELRYSVPMGEIVRPPLPHDVPATVYALAASKESGGRAVVLLSDSKYGFRGTEEGLAMTLIRSSIDPDPWPEVGEHQINIGLGLVDDDGTCPGLTALSFNEPLLALTVPSGQRGSRPLQTSLFAVSGQRVFLSAIKETEDGHALLVRLYSLSDQPEVARLSCWSRPVRAVLTNLMEHPLNQTENQPEINGPTVRVVIPAHGLLNIRLEW
ncbi:MAG: hypothetical protein GX173_08430, partial [Ruminococcaceae bacterium]|nr:hypothetical protein [Oscillospiraceae bacterium]